MISSRVFREFKNSHINNRNYEELYHETQDWTDWERLNEEDDIAMDEDLDFYPPYRYSTNLKGNRYTWV